MPFEFWPDALPFSDFVRGERTSKRFAWKWIYPDSGQWPSSAFMVLLGHDGAAVNWCAYIVKDEKGFVPLLWDDSLTTWVKQPELSGLPLPEMIRGLETMARLNFS